MLEFQAISWCAKNSAEYKCVVHIFGRTEAGASVHVEVPFEPWFYVQSKQGHAACVERVRRALKKGLGLVTEACRPVQAVSFAGFTNGRRDTFTRIQCDSIVSDRPVSAVLFADGGPTTVDVFLMCRSGRSATRGTSSRTIGMPRHSRATWTPF